MYFFSASYSYLKHSLLHDECTQRENRLVTLFLLQNK